MSPLLTVDGRPIADAPALADWFRTAIRTREGLGPQHDGPADRLGDEGYRPEFVAAFTQVLDDGPSTAREEVLKYLQMRPVDDAPALLDAYRRAVHPPATWLDDRTAGGTPLGLLLTNAAIASGAARQPALSQAFLAVAPRFDSTPSWVCALAIVDIDRALAALATTDGSRFSPGQRALLRSIVQRLAPDRLDAVNPTIGS